MKIFLILLAILLIAGGGYFLGLPSSQSPTTPKSNPSTNQLTPQPSSYPQAEEGMYERVGVGIGQQDVRDILQASFDSKNFGDIKAHLASKVLLIRDSTSCCGTGDQTKAVDFIAGSASNGAGWSFDDKNSTIKKVKAVEGFEDVIIGVSNGPVLVFKLDKNSKIIEVTSYVNYKMITGE